MNRNNRSSYDDGRFQMGTRDDARDFEGGRYTRGVEDGFRRSDQSGYSSYTGYDRDNRDPRDSDYRYLRGKPPKGYTRSDDRIREEICDLIMQQGIDASDVELTVKNGEVSLSGTVSERRTKRAIEDLCDQCAGVRDVQNSLRIKSSDTWTASDSTRRVTAS